MAERRMFAKSIVFSDDFTDMPAMARLLYIYLSMAADDDGFLNNPKSVVRMSGAGNEDMEYLKEKGYIISFDSGVIAIRDWKTNNSIRKDRYKPTVCKKEKHTLNGCSDNGETEDDAVSEAVTSDEQIESNEITAKEQKEKETATATENTLNLNETNAEPKRNQSGTTPETQYRLGKDRLGKDRLDKGSVGKNRGDNAHAGAEEILPPSDTVFSCEGEKDFPTPNNSIGDVNENTTPFGNVSEHPTPFDNSFGGKGMNTPSDNPFAGEGKEAYLCDGTPTLKDIKDFCQKESLVFVNSEIFFNHYDAFSWRYPDGTRIKNWQALLKKWNAQDREKNKSNFQGRNDDFYTNELFDDVSKLEV